MILLSLCLMNFSRLAHSQYAFFLMFVVRSSFYNSASLPRNVQVCMTDILIQIVDEVGVSGQEVVELIFEQFIKHEKVI